MAKTHRYLEDLYAEKKHLGAEIKFAPKTLEIKKNAQGVNGIFTTRALPVDYTLMSVNRAGSSLTLFRAYDEARTLLTPLGLEKFYLDKMIVLAAALYLRWTHPDNAKHDILVTSKDLIAEYKDSPMICYGSTELIELRGINAKNSLSLKLKAESLDNLLSKLDVNEHYFRALLAYTQSRAFGILGVIPVFDWINSATKDDSNTALAFDNPAQFSFKTLQNIEAGQELLWTYNQSDAIDTWFAYGYVDPLRPTSAQLNIPLTEAEIAGVIQISSLVLHWQKSTIFPPGVINPSLWIMNLSCPSANLPSTYRARRAMEDSLSSFKNIRVMCRLLKATRDNISADQLSAKILSENECKLGTKFEISVLQTMYQAIQEGIQDLHTRVLKFQTGRFGRSVDIAPYIQMRESAAEQWCSILKDLLTLCEAPDQASYLIHLKAITGINELNSANAAATLHQLLNHQPCIRLKLIEQYLIGRHFI